MNLLHVSEVREKPILSQIRATLLATTLAVAGCVAPKAAPPPPQPKQNLSGEKQDIDNPIFITLVGLSAEIQVLMECDTTSRSLQSIWEIVTKGLKEIN